MGFESDQDRYKRLIKEAAKLAVELGLTEEDFTDDAIGVYGDVKEGE